MVVGGAPEKNETHVKDIALGNETRCNHDLHQILKIPSFNLMNYFISGTKFPRRNRRTYS